MNDLQAGELLHAAAGTVVHRPAPVAEILHRSARARRRRRAVSAALGAAVLVALVVGGAGVLRLGIDLSGTTPSDTPSLSPLQLVQGQWRPLNLFGRDVSAFRTIDGTPAYVTFDSVFVSAEYGYNSGGGRYRIGTDGQLTVDGMSSSSVGCRRGRHRCPVIRNADALEAATAVSVHGDQLQLIDGRDHVIATYRRAR